MTTNNESVVVSLGGSVINPGEPNMEFVRSVSNVFNDFEGKLGIITGGGTYARVYASAIRELSHNEFFADEVAIMETKQNALIMISALRDVCPYVPETLREAVSLLDTYGKVVLGGAFPGITTDAVSVMLAEVTKAKRVVNVSNTDGVYDKNPKKYKDAKKFDEMSLDELLSLAYENDKRSAGEHFIFDLLACKLAVRSSIEVHFVPNNLEDIHNALRGRSHSGTVARP